jgi:lactoylglutathione lyase
MGAEADDHGEREDRHERPAGLGIAQPAPYGEGEPEHRAGGREVDEDTKASHAASLPQRPRRCGGLATNGRFVQYASRSKRENGSMPDLEMTLGWVIVYVDDPAAANEFYERAFGLRGEFVAPGGSFAQLDTGPTKLAFAAYTLGEENFAGGVRRAGGEGQPPNVEIALVAEDVDGAYARALKAGCSALAEPSDKPQGQRVAYVRDPYGTLVELATPL